MSKSCWRYGDAGDIDHYIYRDTDVAAPVLQKNEPWEEWIEPSTLEALNHGCQKRNRPLQKRQTMPNWIILFHAHGRCLWPPAHAWERGMELCTWVLPAMLTLEESNVCFVRISSLTMFDATLASNMHALLLIGFCWSYLMTVSKKEKKRFSDWVEEHATDEHYREVYNTTMRTSG